ncbi:hypothetical protein AVEN_86644-1, partial [Araneus ventricosus]
MLHTTKSRGEYFLCLHSSIPSQTESFLYPFQFLDIDECETNNTCHPSATCRNTFGSFECGCPDGYKGHNGRIAEPGEVCEDIDECRETPSACWFYDNVKCVNLPGSYKCECLQGYEPSRYFDEPHRTTCVK